MKPTQFTNLVVLGLILSVAAATGCRKRPEDVRYIPPRPKPAPYEADTNMGPVGPLVSTESTNVTYPMSDPNKWTNYTAHPEVFEVDTVHFAFDSSVVRKDDSSKVAHVADYLKAHAGDAVKIEGHCDERGTAEYNRALGERRALAVREELIRLGISPGDTDTISFGFEQPVDPGHNEAAWAKNRRAVFILMTPPGK